METFTTLSMFEEACGKAKLNEPEPGSTVGKACEAIHSDLLRAEE